MKKICLFIFMYLVGTQLWAQKAVLFKIKYLPDHTYQSNITVDMKVNATVTGDQQVLDKLKEQGITQPVNANLSLAFKGLMKIGAPATDKSLPVNMDYKVNNISVTANGKQVPIPPKATEKDIKLVGHISQDWRLMLDSANGKAVTDTAKRKIEQMMNMLQNQIKFPDKPLKPGDSFTQGGPISIPGKDSSNVKINAGVTYKLIRIADGKAYFELIPIFSLNMQVKDLSIEMSGRGTGDMVYSIKDNFPLSKEGNVTMKVKVTSPKVNVDGTALVTSKYDCVIN